MRLGEIIDIIKFNISDTNTLNGKDANATFTNKTIITQLKIALNKYASQTKAYERIFSTEATINQNTIEPPPRVLKSQGIRFLVLFKDGVTYPLLDKDLNNIYGNFPVQDVAGISSWFLYWGDGDDTTLQLFPTFSSTPLQTKLSKKISASDTTINLIDTIALPKYNGRVKIGNEKVVYKSRTNDVLNDCSRGAEDTIAANHSQNTAVVEQNIHVFYKSLYTLPDVLSDDTIPEVELNKNVPVAEEHVENVTDYASFKLLSKIDTDRAGFFKFNFNEWLDEIEFQVKKGRSEIVTTDEVRNMYAFETNIPYYDL